MVPYTDIVIHLQLQQKTTNSASLFHRGFGSNHASRLLTNVILCIGMKLRKTKCTDKVTSTDDETFAIWKLRSAAGIPSKVHVYCYSGLTVSIVLVINDYRNPTKPGRTTSKCISIVAARYFWLHVGRLSRKLPRKPSNDQYFRNFCGGITTD